MRLKRILSEVVMADTIFLDSDHFTACQAMTTCSLTSVPDHLTRDRWPLHRWRLKRQFYFSSFTGGGVSREESVHYHQAIFAGNFLEFLCLERSAQKWVSSCGVP